VQTLTTDGWGKIPPFEVQSLGKVQIFYVPQFHLCNMKTNCITYHKAKALGEAGVGNTDKAVRRVPDIVLSGLLTR
jgi:hypothetical protein